MICLHTVIQLDVLMSERAGAHTHTYKLKTTHIFNGNDSSKHYFRTRLKTTFSITIKTSLFNLIWKVFFRSFSLLLILGRYIPFCRFFTSIWHCDSVIWCVIIAIQFIKYLFVSFWCVFSLPPPPPLSSSGIFFWYFGCVCVYVCIHSQGLEVFDETCN